MCDIKSKDVIDGRYVVVRGPAELSSLRGGMGMVYLCLDAAEDGRPVALKTFQRRFLADRSVRDRSCGNPRALAAAAWLMATLGNTLQAVAALGDARRLAPEDDWVQHMLRVFEQQPWWKGQL
jgi:hypothetical protein